MFYEYSIFCFSCLPLGALVAFVLCIWTPWLLDWGSKWLLAEEILVLIHGDIATVWQAVLIGTRNIICSWPACVLHSRRQKKNSTLSYYVNWQWCKDLDQIPQQIQEWMFRERNCSFASCSPVLWTRSDAKGLPHRLCHRAVLYCN